MSEAAEDLVTPESATIDFLMELFDAAYMKVSTTDVGVAIVEDRRIYVDPINNGKALWFVATFSVRESATRLEKLEYVNKVNTDLVMIRAYTSGENLDRLALDYTLCIDGGVTKKTIVYAVKRFLSVVNTALAKDENNVIE